MYNNNNNLTICSKGKQETQRSLQASPFKINDKNKDKSLSSSSAFDSITIVKYYRRECWETSIEEFSTVMCFVRK